MDIKHITEPKLIPALRWLGKYHPNWLRWKPVPLLESPHPATAWSLHLPGEIPQSLPEAIRRGLRLLNEELRLAKQVDDQFGPFHHFALSKALADGLKVVQPYPHQCQALTEVDINCNISDYRQPYPVVVVEIPEGFRKNLKEKHNHPSPKYVLCLHDEDTGYIYTFSVWPDDSQHPVCELVSPRYDTIEDALRMNATDVAPGGDLETSVACCRVALNLMLLLTNYGVRSLGPLGKMPKTKPRKRSKKRKKGLQQKQDHAAIAAAQGEIIGFEQDIVFYHDKSGNEKLEPGDGDGSPKRPHWRRGHYRRQRWGEGGRLRKLVFVPPVLVNASQFQGDKANTHVGYRVHRMNPKFAEGEEGQP